MFVYWKESDNFLPGSTDQTCKPSATSRPQGNFTVQGRLRPDQPPNSSVKYWAANPIDRRDSYVGSGLPFPNAEIAFENTPNTGVVQAVTGRYTIKLFYPNSFYTEGGRTLLPPHVLVKVCGDSTDDIQAIVLGAPLANKALTNLPGGYTRSSFKERGWDYADVSKFI